jgi:hypothetical protein
MRTAFVVQRALLAAICVLTAAPNRVHGQVELYAGPSKNRFSLLRDSATTSGFEFGGRYGVLSWLALDAGYTDFGKVSSAFPATTNLPPMSIGLSPIYMGINSFHVDACAAYLMPELRCQLGTLFSGSLGFGLARFETRIGSNLFEQYSFALPAGWPAYPDYSGTSRSWTGIGRASLRAAIWRSWTAEVSAHLTSASAIEMKHAADSIFNDDIGNRRLQVFGVALDLVWRLPAK